MYLVIVLLPLIGAMVAGFFGKSIGKQGAILVTTTCVGISAFLSSLAFY